MLNPTIDARVLIIRCEKDEQLVGLRWEDRGRDNWWLTWTFPMPESQSGGGGDAAAGGTMTGSFEFDPGIRICARCGNDAVFLCSCGHWTCWSGADPTVTCAWCGEVGQVGGDVDRISPSPDR